MYFARKKLYGSSTMECNAIIWTGRKLLIENLVNNKHSVTGHTGNSEFPVRLEEHLGLQQNRRSFKLRDLITCKSKLQVVVSRGS